MLQRQNQQQNEMQQVEGAFMFAPTVSVGIVLPLPSPPDKAPFPLLFCTIALASPGCRLYP